MGLCKLLYHLVRNFLVIFFIVVLLPGLPPKTHFDFQAFTIQKPANLSGALEVNHLLDNGERLFEGLVHGPEALLKRGNDIYASIHGGEIVKITGDHITHVAKFGKPCEGLVQEAICGRPLGMEFDTLGNNLIVADAYYGIWTVDLSTGKKTQLISPTEELDGKIRRPAKIFNSVAVSKSGDIYWTDSSSDFLLQDGVFTLFANPSGRLFKYDRKTKQTKALIDEIFFANGVALSPDEDFVLVTELAASRLLRYYLKGSKSGTWDVFIDRLPGISDNLTPDADGLWVPLVLAVDAENPALWQSAASTPLIRKFLSRALALLELPFKLIEQVYPNPFSANAIHKIGHFETIGGLSPARQTILRIDWQGKIVGSLHGFDRSVHTIAHVMEDGDYLYLGSYSNKYIGRVKLPKSYKSAKPTQTPPVAQKETVKPVAAPKVTTTTPPPTTTKAPTTTQKATTAAPTTTTQKPKTTAAPKATPKPKEPAPIHETVREDTKPPAQEKIKVIKKGGAQGEL